MQKKGTVLLSTAWHGRDWLAAAGQELSRNLAPFLLLNPVFSAKRTASVKCFLSLRILSVKIVSTGPDTEAKERVQQRPSSWLKIVSYRKDDDC